MIKGPDLIKNAIFKEEAYDLLSDIEQVLLEMEDIPDSDELVLRLFRAIHAVKGAGAIFGFSEVSEFAQKMETLINAVRNGTVSLTEEVVDTLFMARDHILLILDVDPSEEETIHNDTERIVQMMQAHLP
ncbi:MAG: Hpt domain-containing protein [Thermodesulfobacteriota bacterium]|nr:Hpt domain-containing protein [Thermodesulfobacteriota bacterium]